MATNDTKKPAAETGSNAKTAAGRRAPTATGQRGRQQAESIGFLAIAGGILLALNILGIFFFFRADTTQNRAYSLSDGSRRVVRELESDLTVTAYFTQDLPPPFNATERYVRDILAEYEAASRGNLHVRVIHPDDEEEREDAEQAGVRMMQHQRLESDRVSVVEGYRGLVFEYLGDREVIAALPEDSAGLEYAITTAIKQLTEDDLEIGVLSGHESPTPTKGLATLQRMLPTYTIREVDGANEIDRDLRALLVIDPKSELSETELRHVDQFVMRGGSLGVFGGAMKVATDSAPEITAEPTGAGLNRLLERWGVRMEEDIVADLRCGQVPYRHPLGLMIPQPYPPAPTINFTDEQAQHPALFRLQGTQLFFASSLTTTEQFRSGEQNRVLMRSSEESWRMSGDEISLRIRPGQEWQQVLPNEFDGPHTLAVAIQGTLPSAFGTEGASSTEGSAGSDSAASSIEAPEHSEREVRVLVVGTSTMMRDEFLPPADRVSDAELAGAMAFALNAIDWLAQDSDLIAVRAKSIEDPPIDEPRSLLDATADAQAALQEGDEEEAREAIERRNAALAARDRTKAWFRWGNTLLIPIAFALFGVVRWQLRQRRRATLKL